jgi:hypothetical protein
MAQALNQIKGVYSLAQLVKWCQSVDDAVLLAKPCLPQLRMRRGLGHHVARNCSLSPSVSFVWLLPPPVPYHNDFFLLSPPSSRCNGDFFPWKGGRREKKMRMRRVRNLISLSSFGEKNQVKSQVVERKKKEP